MDPLSHYMLTEMAIGLPVFLLLYWLMNRKRKDSDDDHK